MSYMVASGLGPYFSQLTITDIIKGQSFFNLHFDETGTSQVKKHKNLLGHYWSEKYHDVMVNYLTSVMFGQAKFENVVK